LRAELQLPQDMPSRKAKQEKHKNKGRPIMETQTLTLTVRDQETALKLIRLLKGWKVFGFSVKNDGAHTFHISGLTKNQMRRLRADF
jgi:hypothetical protein